MSIRMFEYDVHISLTYQSSPQSLNFPFSAVLFLQDNKNIPNILFCKIHFQNGCILDYAVPAVKVQISRFPERKQPKRYDKPVTQIFYPCVFE